MFPKLFCGVALSSLVLPAAAGAQSALSFDLNPVPQAPNSALLQPVERVPRANFGGVGPFPLTEQDLSALVYPSADAAERAAVLEGLTFFTTPHTAQEGAGPIANQPMCLGCHMSSADAQPRDRKGNRLVTTVSQVSRAARSTPTNFDFTGFDPATRGGRAADNIDAITNTGLTAAFTLFGLFSPSPPPNTPPFNGLTQFSNNSVQHTRPSLPGCLPDPLPFALDPNLTIPPGFRPTTGERAGPPYIGRGLMEAVPDSEILAMEAAEKEASQSSLDVSELFPECSGDCIAGRHNENTSNQAFVGGDPNRRVGRFGLRAAGPTMLQFVVGGLQGELGFTSELNGNELFSLVNVNRPGCPAPTQSITAPAPPAPGVPPQVPLSTPISLRALLRLTAPPEFGQALLNVLNSLPNVVQSQPLLDLVQLQDGDKAQPSDFDNPASIGPEERRVRRGATLFGVDLIAFANRMIPGRMPSDGDGRDPNAINQADRKLNCVGCHTPVVATGVLPAESGTRHVSNVWAPLFSDLLLHQGPSIDAERDAPTPRLPLLVQRANGRGEVVETYDLQRGLADDTLPNQGVATGREFRTAPLMGLGRMGPPFLHDARVFLSTKSVLTTPASTVYSNGHVTNAPLVIHTLDDAIRAAIELHDLPAPFDAPAQSTAIGGGCPVPPGNKQGDVVYGNGAADICPPYDSTGPQQNRGEARGVIARFRGLSAADQQAVIEFLKQL